MLSGSNLPSTGFQVYPSMEQMGDLSGSIWGPKKHGKPQQSVFHVLIYFIERQIMILN